MSLIHLTTFLWIWGSFFTSNSTKWRASDRAPSDRSCVDKDFFANFLELLSNFYW